MIIAYDSKTGNVKRFVGRLSEFSIQITSDLVLDQPFLLITYTTGFGKVPKTTAEFLEKNHKFLRGVAASGNRNWGKSFTKSATNIAETYKVPVVHRFEMSGMSSDVFIVKKWLEEQG